MSVLDNEVASNSGAPDANIAPSAPPDLGTPQTAQPTQPSRLLAILGAVAKVGTTALSGIPSQGRPNFVSGLGQGARAEQAAEATQQAVKFKTFDDQVRLATLHAQDRELALRTQQQQDAHQKMQDAQADYDEAHGVTYDPHPNDGTAVIGTLQAQTAANGTATIVPGTHLSADGKSVNVPSTDESTQAGLLSKYRELSSAIPGVPAFPGMATADHVPASNLDVMTHVMQGYKPDGTPWEHKDLVNLIPALQSQRARLAKSGNATPYQLSTLDTIIGIYKANEKAHSDFEDQVFKKSQAQQLDTLDKSEKIKTKYAMEKQDNQAGDKAANAKPQDTTELNAVAYDPNYANPDGTKGANIVMSKSEAAAKGLTHYKADPSTINTVVAGMNDVQTKLNQLADVANDRQKMSQVDPGQAAAMLAHGKGITLEFGAHGSSGSGGVGVDTSRINEDLYSHDVMKANQATRDFVAAYIGAHEAVTQLPRLQTFGKSNRMTEKQMEAAQNLLPQPGDREFASQKMTSLQGMIDPLRKQIPRMPGAEQIPSWLETRQQQQRQAVQSRGSNLGAVMGDPGALINRLR
jgi:hypothetical protein